MTASSCRWLVRGAVIVVVATSFLARGLNLVDLLMFGEMPPQRQIVFMVVDSFLLDVTWGAMAWRWWGR